MIFKGRKKGSSIKYFLSNLNKRLAKWAGNLLSFRGRMPLIKSTLQATHIHCLRTIALPSSVLHQINQILSNLLPLSIIGSVRTGLVELFRKVAWVSDLSRMFVMLLLSNFGGRLKLAKYIFLGMCFVHERKVCW